MYMTSASEFSICLGLDREMYMTSGGNLNLLSLLFFLLSFEISINENVWSFQLECRHISAKMHQLLQGREFKTHKFC